MLSPKWRKACLLAVVAVALLATPTTARAQHDEQDDGEEPGYTTCENGYSSCGCHRGHGWYCGRKHETKTTGTCGTTGSCALNHWRHGNCYIADGGEN